MGVNRIRKLPLGGEKPPPTVEDINSMSYDELANMSLEEAKKAAFDAGMPKDVYDAIHKLAVVCMDMIYAAATFKAAKDAGGPPDEEKIQRVIRSAKETIAKKLYENMKRGERAMQDGGDDAQAHMINFLTTQILETCQWVCRYLKQGDN